MAQAGSSVLIQVVKSRTFHNFSEIKNFYLSNALVQKWKIREKRLCCLFFFKVILVTN